MELFKNAYFIILVVLLITITIIQLARRNDIHMYHEGFEQQAPFVLKNDKDVYDSFYAIVYDELNKTGERTAFECNKIIELTKPSTNNSVFLDVGSGTGHLVNSLTNLGYQAHGLDLSKDMIEYSQKKFPDIQTKCGDTCDPLVYDRLVFTHITCTNYTIYHLKDKNIFFRNCYHWLMPNGFLIVHLVDKDKYNPLAPIADKISLKNANLYNSSRKTDATIEFKDFEYATSHDVKPHNHVIVKETFTDSVTKHVRQNELTLYMENKEDIVKMAQNNGFLAHALINLPNDDYQYIYVFERLL
uniref:Methyltransferase type 11 domain-containing protein n=1 Tax=viral metagenome TaxID=1070528 RepID=A0A6C0F170_9ZZZZ